MSRLWHGWVPVLLVLGIAAAVVLWSRHRAAAQRPLTLADEELAPYTPFGTHPVVLPQTFIPTPTLAPAVPPTMPAGATPMVAG